MKRKLGSRGQMAATAALLSMALAAPASSTDLWLGQRTVTGILMHTSDLHGGCMIRVTAYAQDDIPGCKGQWVSLNCEGAEGGDVVRAYQMIDTAKMAMALNQPVSLMATDDITFNGYCTAKRLDIVQ